MQGVLIIEE